jgi:hypothetical protein
VIKDRDEKEIAIAKLREDLDALKEEKIRI